jgi:histidine triad (HIT) family protein
MTEAADPNCLFCKVVAGQVPSQRVYESDTILAFKDIHPQAPFHCLVIPKVHRATLTDFGEHERSLVGELLFVARQIAAEQGLPGFRVAMNVGREGGQVVFHAHLHVVGGRPLKGELG